MVKDMDTLRAISGSCAAQYMVQASELARQRGGNLIVAVARLKADLDAYSNSSTT
jgi:hypothetical protein